MGNDESVTGAMSRAVLPFVVFYLAWGECRSTTPGSPRPWRRGFAAGGLEGQVQGLEEQHLGLAIGLSVGFPALKLLAEWVLQKRLVQHHNVEQSPKLECPALVCSLGVPAAVCRGAGETKGGTTGLTEFSEADLDRVLGEARATLESIRARRPEAAAGGTEAPAGAGTAADGRIKVTAAPTGRLTEVELDPEAMRLSSDEFGRQLVLAVNAALDDARARSAAATVASAGTAGKTKKKPKGAKSAKGATGEDGTEDGTEQDPGLRQMALLTQAINEALARIG
ncbi:hypothetical protein GCM10010191_44710 [Actinomadura vinacea]|uniref:YbaB/EbfC family DNA-binding protein n=1 Tax=Actinomadura vinacea TaxID=115336 RepID=A0ABP5WJZ9_9ACTN